MNSLVEKGLEESIISQIGSVKFELKEEIKEESFMKEENYDAQSLPKKKLPFKKVLDFFRVKVLDIYKTVEKIKNATMKTIEAF